MDGVVPEKRAQHIAFAHTGTKLDPFVFNQQATPSMDVKIKTAEGACVNGMQYVFVTLAGLRMQYQFEQNLIQYFDSVGQPGVYSKFFLTRTSNAVLETIAGSVDRWTWEPAPASAGPRG